jgi:hypothetical protein
VYIGGAGLPKSWSPTAVALHPREPGTILMAWITGHVFKSVDHGATWAPAEAGLVFPDALRRLPEYGVPYLSESKLNRAVLLGDLAQIRTLAAAGADLSAPGPLGKTPLEWALFRAAIDSRGRIAAYWELRKLGARLPPQGDRTAAGLAEWAGRVRQADVFEDLIRGGWNLSPADDDRIRSLFPAAIASGREAAHWVELQLAALPRGQSYGLVRDLVQMKDIQLAQSVARRDAPHYRSERDLARLIGRIPPEERKLLKLALQPRQLDPDGSADDVVALVHAWLAQHRGNEAMRYVTRRKDVLKDRLADVIDSLLLAREESLVMEFPRRTGIALGQREIDRISEHVYFSCDAALLRRFLGAGSLAVAKGVREAEDAIGATLRGCAEKSPNVADAFIARVHGLGHRVKRQQWTFLTHESLDMLRRSSLKADYAAFEGQTGRVGLLIRSDKDVVIADVVAGSPADDAGLRAGDRILAVDGEQVDNMSADWLVGLLRGHPGTTVKVSVQRTGARVDFALTRRSLPEASQK